MSTSSNENTIFDFEVRKDEIDLAKSVPKLKGASNWRMWETQMFMMLRFNNPVYVQLIRDEIKMPPPPRLPSTQIHLVAVSEPCFSKRLRATKKSKLTLLQRLLKLAPSKLSLQIWSYASTAVMAKRSGKGLEKWEKANNRAFLQFVSTLEPHISSSLYDIINVRVAYLATERSSLESVAPCHLPPV
ncbi:hypothetical protein PCH_Pc22g02360 [Penicillium rubens Wisconsin 54-1255]|uniref:Uncharacterized protein n=1 Tax=Penicillium rubens (strain ATCC 28089 / DSM 1075 / NRRL 1951 / Wisconsin 54-1255) TaxID=500485 RepID=B6HPA2_PENRW|nr:hypothetical protein PCH_Pc22g02360 [Penicillium rubens Wisconsin 54-1255]